MGRVRKEERRESQVNTNLQFIGSVENVKGPAGVLTQTGLVKAMVGVKCGNCVFAGLYVCKIQKILDETTITVNDIFPKSVFLVGDTPSINYGSIFIRVSV